jgi:hypothetical protein
MERAFYTLHLQAFMEETLGEVSDRSEAVVSKFARCVQALLRKAHAKQTCDHHRTLLDRLHTTDTVLSFNYDLVPERALRPVAESRGVNFGPWLYGLDPDAPKGDLPLLLKLHGSSNWRIEEPGQSIRVLTKTWRDLDSAPGYLGQFKRSLPYPPPVLGQAHRRGTLVVVVAAGVQEARQYGCRLSMGIFATCNRHQESISLQTCGHQQSDEAVYRRSFDCDSSEVA